MFRSAIVETGQTPALVTNVIEYETDLNGQIPPGMSDSFMVVTGMAEPGWLYVDGILQPPVPQAAPPPVRRAIVKSLVLSRLTDQQLDAALAAMTTRQKERWRSPDAPTIYVDDPEILGLLQAIGADPDVVLAP